MSNNHSSKIVQEVTDIIRLQTSLVLDEVRGSVTAITNFVTAPKVNNTSLPKHNWKPDNK